MKFRYSIFLFFFSVILSAQTVNKIVEDAKSGKKMLVGLCNREAFKDTNFAWWFNSEYNFYDFHDKVVSKAELSKELKNKTIEIYMGTWCSDSRREAPRLYKILDSINFPDDKIKLVMVDRKKKAGDIDISAKNIRLVPTIIISENGGELGRIIEAPEEETLEADLMRILNGGGK